MRTSLLIVLALLSLAGCTDPAGTAVDTDGAADAGDYAYGAILDDGSTAPTSSAFIPADFGITWMLPAIDWREVNGDPYVTSVKEQGNSGSCTFFSSTAAIESSYMIQEDLEANISEQYMIDCSGWTASRTVGYAIDDVGDDWKNIGSVDDVDVPYLGVVSPAQSACSSHAALAPQYDAIESYRLYSAEDIKAALHLGPVVTGFAVSGNFNGYTSGIYEVGSSALTGSGHAVTIVGFDDNDGDGYWIVKNSWDTDWGEDGYIRVAYGQTGWEAESYWYKVSSTDYTRGLDLIGYSEFCEDVDGDHYGEGANCSGEDCDDADASTNDGAAERCDDVDNDCDGDVDEEVMSTYFLDTDGDGYGTPSYTYEGCSNPPGWVANATDCADAEVDGVAGALIHPNATELCDATDNDCDGDIDEGFDADADGWETCEGDCDDADPEVYSDGTSGNERCGDGIDQDCSGGDLACLAFCTDPDGDTWGTGGGCLGPDPDEVGVDTDGDGTIDVQGWEIHPGATEACDLVDNDIDGDTDEEVTDTFFRDTDGDGYGDAAGPTEACDTPAGYAENSADCDDGDASTHSAATEICDGVDNNCDGAIDEGADADLDGWTECEGDCNDVSAVAYPGATDICGDGIDNDCDGTEDTSCGIWMSEQLIELDPEAGDTSMTVYVPIIEGASDSIAFLSVENVVDTAASTPSGDRANCDYTTTFVNHGNEWEITVDMTSSCGSIRGETPFKARAVVLADLGGSGYLEAARMDIEGPSSASISVPSDTMNEAAAFCALDTLQDDGDDNDTEWICEVDEDWGAGTVSSTIRQDYGNGNFNMEAQLVLLGTGANITGIEKVPFQCNPDGEEDGETIIVSHALGDGPDHVAVMLPLKNNTDSDDHLYFWTNCAVGAASHDCSIGCDGTSNSFDGEILFMDGTFLYE